MKKLKLKLIGDNIVLSKDQMKKIGGGYVCPCSVVIQCSWYGSGNQHAGSVLSMNVDCGDFETMDELCDINYPGSIGSSCNCTYGC